MIQRSSLTSPHSYYFPTLLQQHWSPCCSLNILHGFPLLGHYTGYPSAWKIFSLDIPIDHPLASCRSCSNAISSEKLWYCVKSLSRVATPWTVARQAPLSMEFSGKNTGVSCHFLLQGIFLTQGSYPGLPHCRQILYRLNHQGSLTHFIVPLNKYHHLLYYIFI